MQQLSLYFFTLIFIDMPHSLTKLVFTLLISRCAMWLLWRHHSYIYDVSSLDENWKRLPWTIYSDSFYLLFCFLWLKSASIFLGVCSHLMHQTITRLIDFWIVSHKLLEMSINLLDKSIRLDIASKKLFIC